MIALVEAPWFHWALAVVVGLPVGLVALTEAHNGLARRGSALARPVGLIRSYLLPLAALLVLLVKASQVPAQATPVRVVATVFGVAVLVLALSGLNATLFQGAPAGSWRRRVPAIFLDVARFLLIAVGLAVILSYVWGANVGGLFTALGISSIVLGLTLQNSVGQIISGLFLLFEQPFQLGDWIDTESVQGRVVEVNWRATHIHTDAGLQIIPNSVLAEASFTNLSRPPGHHAIAVETVFALYDPPDRVCALLDRVAAALPQCRADSPPESVPAGGNRYTTSIALRSPADDDDARATFLRWLWYAARRADLHLDRADDGGVLPDQLERALHVIAPLLRLSAADQDELRRHLRIDRYGAQETLQSPGAVPDEMGYLVDGQVALSVTTPDGAVIAVRTLVSGDCLGQTTLTREPVRTAAHAVVETAVVVIARHQLEELVQRKPLLLAEIGRAIDEQREGLQRALAAAGH